MRDLWFAPNSRASQNSLPSCADVLEPRWDKPVLAAQGGDSNHGLESLARRRVPTRLALWHDLDCDVNDKTGYAATDEFGRVSRLGRRRGSYSRAYLADVRTVA
jgi:hypothetical protein